MRIYKVVLLLNLALGVGFLFGSLWRTREVARLQGEVTSIRQGETLRPSTEASWSAHGIVRLISPQINRIFIDHGDIPGLMEAMTMGFEPVDPKLLTGLAPGDQIRFTLQKKGEHLLLTAVEKTDPAQGK
jgi:Cu/Ag efflux protein CusF